MAKEELDEKKKANTVFALSRASRCYGCDLKMNVDDIVKLNKKNEDESEVFCLKCSDLSDLEILKSGNAVVTRLSKKYSKRHFVIVKWSELWKTYERVGLLVETEALKKAREEAAKT